MELVPYWRGSASRKIGRLVVSLFVSQCASTFSISIDGSASKMMLVNPQTGSIERKRPKIPSAAVAPALDSPAQHSYRRSNSADVSLSDVKFDEISRQNTIYEPFSPSSSSDHLKISIESRSDPDATDDGLEVTNDDQGNPQVLFNQSNIMAELKTLAKLSWPLWLTNLSSFSAGFINTFLVGRLGKVALGAAALSNMYCIMTGLSLGIGLLTASDTLCAQAYGAKNYKRVGLLFQRSVAIMVALCAPVLLFWTLSESILLAVKQDPEIAALVGRYTRVAFAGFPFLMLFESLKRYLQAQSITSPPMWVSLGCGLFSLPMGWFYIFYLNLGYIGAAASVGTSWFLQGFFLAIYTYFSKAWVNTWPTSFSIREIIQWRGVKEYLALGVPGMLMSCAEWWGFELYALMSGWISQVALAAQTAMMTTSSLLYMIPLSLAVATTILVGNRLGAGKYAQAVFCYKVATLITSVIALICSVVLLSLKNKWGYAFTNDKDVAEAISTNLPFLCFFLIGDCLQGTLGGALRGSGRQKWGAAINLISYYCLGMPIAAALAFAAGWGISGLWSGFSLGSWVVVTCYSLLLLKFSNWPEIARKAQEDNKTMIQDESNKIEDEIPTAMA